MADVVLASRPARAARAAAVVAAAVPAGIALGLALSAHPLRLAATVGVGCAAVAVLALAILRPRAAVALGVALLGLGGVADAPGDLVIFVLMAVALVSGGFDLRRVPGPALASLVVFAALELVSAVQVTDVGRAARFAATTAFVAAFALWVASYVWSHGRGALVARAYVGGAVAAATYGIVARLTPVSLPHHDLLGALLVPAALIVLEELFAPRLLVVRAPLRTLALIVLVAGIASTSSRVAWLSLVVGAAVVGVVLSARAGGARSALAFVVLAAPAVVFGVIVSAPQAPAGLSSSLDVAGRYPFGAGPGQIDARGSYVRVLGEQGLPGLAALAALLAFTLAAALRRAARCADTCGIGTAALLGAWCAVLVSGVFADTLHWRHVWLLAGLLWAGGASYARAASDARRPGAPSP